MIHGIFMEYYGTLKSIWQGPHFTNEGWRPSQGGRVVQGRCWLMIELDLEQPSSAGCSPQLGGPPLCLSGWDWNGALLTLDPVPILLSRAAIEDPRLQLWWRPTSMKQLKIGDIGDRENHKSGTASPQGTWSHSLVLANSVLYLLGIDSPKNLVTEQVTENTATVSWARCPSRHRQGTWCATPLLMETPGRLRWEGADQHRPHRPEAGHGVHGPCGPRRGRESRKADTKAPTGNTVLFFGNVRPVMLKLCLI